MNFLVNACVKKVVLESQIVSIDDTRRAQEIPKPRLWDCVGQKVIQGSRGREDVSKCGFGVGREASITGRKTLLLQCYIFFSLSSEVRKKSIHSGKR